ncbi:MAG: hypothetical protein OXG78_16820 [Chloroflexi bacterium]|nr:hypothetical protein [Chloroflexota bacterium]
MRRTSRQVIAATSADLKNNRLGLMSQQQLQTLHGQIQAFEARMAIVARRGITLAIIITVAVVALSFARVILLPVALAIEVAVVAVLLYMTTDFNRFVQHLILDREAEAVRIVKGRTSHSTLRPHILYHTLRIELQSYKLLDVSLAREFTTGELYQFYVLPQSRAVIAAEGIGEKNSIYD